MERIPRHTCGVSFSGLQFAIHLLLAAVLMLSPLSHAQPIYDGKWYNGTFGECSRRCGPRHRSRDIFCVSQGNILSQTRCNPATRPSSTEPCAPVDCPPAAKRGSWNVCAACQQVRMVSCLQLLSTGERVVVNNSHCNVPSMETRICPAHLCQPGWRAHAFNCCDPRAALGRRCYDTISNRFVSDEACIVLGAANMSTSVPPCLGLTCAPVPTTTPYTTMTSHTVSPSADTFESPADGGKTSHRMEAVSSPAPNDRSTSRDPDSAVDGDRKTDRNAVDTNVQLESRSGAGRHFIMPSLPLAIVTLTILTIQA